MRDRLGRGEIQILEFLSGVSCADLKIFNGSQRLV
jgi:hypothetical protein